jgi:hypothetical protein
MHLSDDESPFDKSDFSPNPAGGKMKVLSPMGDPDVSRPFVVTRGRSAAYWVLDELLFVRRVVGMADGVPGMAAVLEGRLVLGSAARLEVVLGTKGPTPGSRASATRIRTVVHRRASSRGACSALARSPTNPIDLACVSSSIPGKREAASPEASRPQCVSIACQPHPLRTLVPGPDGALPALPHRNDPLAIQAMRRQIEP